MSVGAAGVEGYVVSVAAVVRASSPPLRSGQS